jgi:hypothetical protein
MAVHRGGHKRPYKKKGRLSARKCYQLMSRAQHKAGMCASGRGPTWMQVSQVNSGSIKHMYEMNFR